jgi:hypothetical protein
MSFDCAAALSSDHARSPGVCSAPASRSQLRRTAVGSVWCSVSLIDEMRPSSPALEASIEAGYRPCR